MTGGELGDRLWSVLFPKRCVLCGRVVEYETLWCGRCPCPPPVFQSGQPGEKEIVAPFSYEGGVREAVIRLKTEPDPRIVAFFANALAEALYHRLEEPSLWRIVPVPIHPDGLRQRGYNQAELLGGELSRHLNIPMDTGLLLRLDSPVHNRELGREDRFRHADGTYRARQGAALPPGASILLVDDVFTTGATTAACAARLGKLGAARLLVAAAAKTPYRR